jgi:protein KRI1
MELDQSDSDSGARAFKINKSFANTYEQKKRREEENAFVLASSSDESVSETEDEDGDLLTGQVDAQIMKTILMIQNKDPKVYEGGDLFEGIDVPEASGEKKEKPFTIKQHHTRELFGEAPCGDAPVTHTQELNAAKSEFIQAADTLDTADDLFTKTTSTEADMEYSQFLLENLQRDGVDPNRLKEWKNSQNEEEGFLLDFVLNRGWMEKGKALKLDDPEEVSDLEELEKMEAFEQAHNFR